MFRLRAPAPVMNRYVIILIQGARVTCESVETRSVVRDSSKMQLVHLYV